MNLPVRQRGAAVLGVTLLMLVVLALMVGFASRNLMFEQRASANQVRSTVAFEAAEAGLEWAQALLNSGRPIGADCTPSEEPGAASFRDRFLAYDATSQRFEPRTWSDGSANVALQAACVLTDTGWSCACPNAGHPTLVAPPVTGAHPAFLLRFVAAPRSGMVKVVAVGCDHFAPACLPGLAGAAAGDATAQTQVLLALAPALATTPIAALTARGDVTAEGPLALANTDATSGGLTVHAGGHAALPLASLINVPGSPASASVAANDAQLSAGDGEGLLTRWLGIDRARWRQLPNARVLRCPADCAADVALALGAGNPYPLLWIAGDLNLEGPNTVGSAEQPVMLVVEGQTRLSGGVQVHGVIVSLAAAWDTSGSTNARVQGALIALGSVVGTGAPTITFDAAVLARLHAQTGSFARVPGSWRDF